MIRQEWADENNRRINEALNVEKELPEHFKNDAAQLIILNATYSVVYERLKAEAKNEQKLPSVVNGMHEFKNQLEELRGLVIEFENNVKAFLAM